MKGARIVVFLSAFLLVVCFSGAARAADFVRPTHEDKCPVCGMFPRQYKDWLAEIVFTDGTYAAFDGPKDLLRYYFHLSQYNQGKTQGDIAAVYVTEYYTLDIIRAEDAFFVLGSDVHGPMGAEFVPIRGEAEAQAFMTDHRGSRMFRFSEITVADVPKMMRKQKKMSGHGL